LYKSVRKRTRSATFAETGLIFLDSHQLAHSFQQELYDFDVLVLHDEQMISAASPEMPLSDNDLRIQAMRLGSDVPVIEEDVVPSSGLGLVDCALGVSLGDPST
jgi:hypothetical protein